MKNATNKLDGDNLRVIHEKETLTDGSVAHNVFIRWNGGFIKMAAQNAAHAKRIMKQMDDVCWTEVTIYG